MTVEKLEDVVDKQLAISQQDAIAEDHGTDEISQLVNIINLVQIQIHYFQIMIKIKIKIKMNKKEEVPPPNPNAMPFGMKDTRPQYIKQQAAMVNNSRKGHRKIPTFGASGLNLHGNSADNDSEKKKMMMMMKCSNNHNNNNFLKCQVIFPVQ